MAANQCRYLGGIGAFNLNEHSSFAPAGPEHFSKRWHRWMKPAEACRSGVANPAGHAADPVQPVIVEYDEFSVGRLLHINFHKVDPQPDRSPDGGE